MTTASTQHPTSGGTTLLLRAAAVAMASVLVLAAVAGLTTGSAGYYGATAGGVVALLVFLGGSLVVNTVAGLQPGLSLVFALSTYLLQVLVIGLFFTVVGDSGLVGDTLSAGWLAASIIEVTVVWLAVQVLLASRARIPVYDLTPQAGER